MSACCIPAWGRASPLFSIWTIAGAPEPIRSDAPWEGTSIRVMKENFQSAASGSPLRFRAGWGTVTW